MYETKYITKMVILIGFDQSLSENIRLKPIAPSNIKSRTNGKSKPKIKNTMVKLYLKI
jgi:hypothetical protein